MESKGPQQGVEECGHDHVAMVMAPYPIQTHVIPLLQLSRLISTFKIHVHFVTTEALISVARSLVPVLEPYLHFHSVPIPSSASSRYPKPTNKTMESFINSKIALSHLGEPILQLVDELKDQVGRKVVLVFDLMMTTTVQHITHVESYCFHVWSAFSFLGFLLDACGKPRDADSFLKQAPSAEECSARYPPDAIFKEIQALNFHTGAIFNTSRITEGLYVDLLDKYGLPRSAKHWALGPLFDPAALLDKDDSKSGRHRCLEWLDNQVPGTVIFVSFGTQAAFTDEQIRELALGLESSGHKFIWLLKDAGELGLPEGYEENVKDKGLVIRDWAPQLKILRHSSIGGFMTHCGSNSCLETILMGVPVATWPLHFDQPMNAELLTKALNMGVVVKDWARRGELVSSGTVETAIRTLMEGDAMRKRAREIGDSVMKSVMEDGATQEMKAFIQHVTG